MAIKGYRNYLFVFYTGFLSAAGTISLGLITPILMMACVTAASFLLSFDQVPEDNLARFTNRFTFGDLSPDDEKTEDHFLSRIILHRGGGIDAPENTLEAIREAARFGVAGVEVDLQFTADGIGVLLHDDTLDRTTDGHGYVWHKTFDEVRMLNAAANHPNRNKYKDQVKVPTLEECVQECLQRNLLLFIDCKSFAKQTADLIDGLFTEYPDLYRSAAVCSFNPYVIYKVRSKNPRIITGLIFRKNYFSCEVDCVTPRSASWTRFFSCVKDWVFNWITYFLSWRLCGNSFLLLNKQSVSSMEVKWWKDLGVQVIPWTVNSEAEKVFFMDHIQVPIITDGVHMTA